MSGRNPTKTITTKTTTKNTNKKKKMKNETIELKITYKLLDSDNIIAKCQRNYVI